MVKAFLGKILTRRCFHNPIFITGPSRSGTSVLLQAIGKHPLILSMPGEAPFITSIGGAAWIFEYGEASDYYRNSLKYPIEYLYHSLQRICFEYAGGPHYALKTILKGLLNRDFSYPNKKYWCAKTFPDLKVCKGLIRIYPSVRFICIVRNGYEVVHSMTKYSGFSQQSFEEQCIQWAETVEKYHSLKAMECVTLVRHEQMVAQADRFFADLFDFLNIEDNGKAADFVKGNIVHPLDQPTKSGIEVRAVFQKRRPSYEGWSSEQREAFKRICGKGMKELGYEMPF